jgi:hypothetical protein
MTRGDDLAAGCAMGMVALVGYALGAVFMGLWLLVLYGIVVLIMRHAFGIELPNPFDWLPPEWRQKLPIH